MIETDGSGAIHRRTNSQSDHPFDAEMSKAVTKTPSWNVTGSGRSKHSHDTVDGELRQCAGVVARFGRIDERPPQLCVCDTRRSRSVVVERLCPPMYRRRRE